MAKPNEIAADDTQWKIENFAFIDEKSLRDELASTLSSLLNEEKGQVMGKLPEAYKLRFRDEGLFENKPVLILGPYDVPCGKVRRQWMEAFFRVVHCIENDVESFLNTMPYLVYDFESERESVEDSVLLVPGKEILGSQDVANWVSDKLKNGEQMIENGLQKLVANKYKLFELPWAKATNDCNAIQGLLLGCGEGPLVKPSETVDPRAGREFGKYIVLNHDKLEVITYHGDFTLVRYPTGQTQWLPLQNHLLDIQPVIQQTSSMDEIDRVPSSSSVSITPKLAEFKTGSPPKRPEVSTDEPFASVPVTPIKRQPAPIPRKEKIQKLDMAGHPKEITDEAQSSSVPIRIPQSRRLYSPVNCNLRQSGAMRQDQQPESLMYNLNEEQLAIEMNKFKPHITQAVLLEICQRPKGRQSYAGTDIPATVSKLINTCPRHQEKANMVSLTWDIEHELSMIEKLQSSKFNQNIDVIRAASDRLKHAQYDPFYSRVARFCEREERIRNAIKFAEEQHKQLSPINNGLQKKRW